MSPLIGGFGWWCLLVPEVPLPYGFLSQKLDWGGSKGAKGPESLSGLRVFPYGLTDVFLR